MKKPRKSPSSGSDNELVALTFRVHPKARLKLKITAPVQGMTMEEFGRAILYKKLGLDLPVVVETATN